MSGGADGAGAWRAIALAVAGLAGALVVLVFASKTVLGWNGDAGLVLAPAERGNAVSVASVTANGPAAQAGIRAGDRIDLRAMPFEDRVFLVATPVANRAIAVTLERGGDVRRTTVVPRRTHLDAYGFVAYLVLLWMAAFAALIGSRRPEMPEARLLSLALSAWVAADVLQYLSTPWPALDDAISAVEMGGIAGAIAVALFVRFAELFGRPLGIARRGLDAIAYVGAIGLGLYGVIGAVALAWLPVDAVPFYFGAGAAALIAGVQFLVVLAGAAAVAGSRGAERQRIAWAVASFGVLFGASIVQIVLETVVPSADMQTATQACVNVIAVLAPVGLTYSVLSRRLLDIGFALNRAAVFSAISIIVVGAFMAVEWTLGNWLQNVTPFASTLVGLALAIALGFSVKLLHDRVDHAIDHLFFHKRHEQEKALLRFAGDAPFITTSDALMRRTVDELAEHSSAGSVAIFRYDGVRTFRPACASGELPDALDENDAALVAMRASKAFADLHRYRTALHGEFAFPMIARGELIGVLVCGAKRGGDPYAPDETSTLATLAQSVGTTLDALAVREAGPNAAIHALQVDVAALRDDVRVLLAAVRLADPR